MNKKVLIGLSTLSLVTILSGIALSSSNSSAASASTATAAVKIAASCTLTSTGGGNYSATVPNGTSAEIPGSTLSVSCNDAGGFALYAVGYSNDTIGNNNMIGASTNIATGTSGNNSYWAMKVNPVSGNTPTIQNSFDSYHVVPDTLTQVASYNQSTGSGSLAVNATYKASISSAQLAGNYLGKVKYTLVHPTTADPGRYEVACEAGKICYNANITQVVGQMGKQSATDGTDVTLYASNFKRTGYGFAGWNTAYDYTGTFYGPNETISAPTGTTANGLSLYAVWVKSAGTIQNWNGCNTLIRDPGDGTANLTSVTALTDSRDGNTYAVAKLADGKCWTIENLRLADKDSNNNYINLSSSNTHNPSLPLTNDYSTSATSNHLSPSTDSTQTAWCDDSDLYVRNPVCYGQSMLNTENTAFFTNNTTSAQDGNIYSYGNYYNWYSATAGHGKIGSNHSGYNAPGDICPAGWRLPTATDNNTNGDFNLLNIALGGTGAVSTASPNTVILAYRTYPNNFVYSGMINASSFNRRNSNGYYWSASEMYTYQASTLIVSSQVIWSVSDTGKWPGYSVRCIAGV